MENQQPEALVLARLFERCVIAFGETETSSRARAAKELRRLHARVQELEAMLDAVGAGGVSAQRVTQKAAPVVPPEPLCWVNEDELPESMSQEAYVALFPYSKVDIVRLFPIFAAPQPQADARDAELLDWLEGEVCDSYTGVTITRVDHREDGMVIERGFRLRRFHKDYEVKPTLRAAIAAAKEKK